MTLVFHERIGLDGRRISPFSWRIQGLIRRSSRPVSPIALYDSLADRFPLYPENRGGPDGRET
jgi:hypothetical protein